MASLAVAGISSIAVAAGPAASGSGIHNDHREHHGDHKRRANFNHSFHERCP